MYQLKMSHPSNHIRLETGQSGSYAVQGLSLGDVKHIELDSHPCAGTCGQRGKWRYITRDYVCENCRRKPPHQLVTRSRVMTELGLTFKELHTALLAKEIHMFTAANPHNKMGDKKHAPSRYYYAHEVIALANRLRVTGQGPNLSQTRTNQTTPVAAPATATVTALSRHRLQSAFGDVQRRLAAIRSTQPHPTRQGGIQPPTHWRVHTQSGTATVPSHYH